jgi:prephenate dehydrogenase
VMEDDVQVLDLDSEEEPDKLAPGVDIAILAVPLPVAPEIAADLARRLPKDALIVDISSMKMSVFVALKACRQAVALIHPMCGPPPELTLKGQPLVIAWENAALKAGGPLADWYARFLAELGGTVHRMTVSEHDRAAKVLQPVIHAALLGIAEQVSASGIPLALLRAIAPPVAAPVLEGLERHLAHGSPDVFVWLQAEAARDRDMNPVKRLARSIEDTAESAFAGRTDHWDRWVASSGALSGRKFPKKKAA